MLHIILIINLFLIHTENEEDFDFIDPSILSQFQHTSISVEKIQKDILNFDDEDDEDIYGEKATRKFEFQIQVNRVLQIFDEMASDIFTFDWACCA